MLKQLGDQSGLRLQCFAVKGSERFSTLNLFAGLLDAFKHPPPEQLQDILDESIPYLQSMISSNTLSIVVLDDAHKVTEKELTQLPAPPEFESRIPDLLPEGADLPYSSLNIDGMTSFRATDFLNFRMQQAGLRGEVPFSEDDVIGFVEDSGGLPGPLQVAAAASLNEQYGPVPFDAASTGTKASAGGSWMHSRMGKIIMGIVASLLIILGLLMFLPSRPNNDNARYTVSKTEPVKMADSELKLVDSNAATSSSSGNSARSTLTPPATAKITLTGSDTDQTLTESTAVDTVADAGTVTEAVENTAAQVTPSVSQSEQSDSENTATEERQIVIVAEREPESNETTVAEPTATAAPVSAATPVVAETAAEPRPGLLESSSWILLQNRELYTVQMSASRDRNSVVSFLNRHADTLAKPNSIYTFDRDGSTWYALLHGLYSSIDEARAAVETMPSSALTNQPWIRSVARVQDVLKAQ